MKITIITYVCLPKWVTGNICLEFEEISFFLPFTYVFVSVSLVCMFGFLPGCRGGAKWDANEVFAKLSYTNRVLFEP